RRLVALRFSGGVPAAGAALSRGGRATGKVTSVAGARGLGMVRLEDETPGTALDAGGVPADVVAVPAWPAPLSRAS
ncbi:MAG TPA: hypothetical protein VH309_07755, partial [Elusimicrobiota bacterium]|nr:hypothetical protein [Elusimicrobiota bacterium]